MAYVYRHIRLDENKPFYIGIGSDANYIRARSKKGRNNLWRKIVFKTDYVVEIMFEHDDYEIIKEKEKEFITLYGRIDIKKGCLSNLTDGGEGVLGHVPSIEKRLNQSLKTKGVKKPNMVGVLAGERNPMFGKTHTKEAREIISRKLKGQLSQEKNPMWGKKRLDLIIINKSRCGEYHPLYGKPTSNETKLKISNALTGIKRTEDQKNNLRIALRNKKRTLRSDSRRIINTTTGEIFNSLKEASINSGVNRSTLADWLKGRYKNKTNFIYYDI